MSAAGGQRAGVHPSCEEPAEMLPRLEAILAWWQHSTPRSLQTALGPSEVGDPCARRIAYKLGQPRSETGLKWGALLGLFGHSGVEGAIRAYNAHRGDDRYIVEERVTADLDTGLAGNTDLYDTDFEEVVDWKFVGKYSLDKYRAAGHPGIQYATQAHIYGRGWVQRGRKVRSVRVVFLARQGKYAESWEWSEPYNEELVNKALARLARIERMSADAYSGAIDIAAIEARPGDACRFCLYLRPNVATDLDGCAGTTRPPVDYQAEAKAASTVEHVQALWRAARDEGRLDDALRATLTGRAQAITASAATAANN